MRALVPHPIIVVCPLSFPNATLLFISSLFFWCVAFTGSNQALRNKSFGSALDFVWSSAGTGDYAIRETISRVKTFKNFKEQVRDTTFQGALQGSMHARSCVRTNIPPDCCIAPLRSWQRTASTPPREPYLSFCRPLVFDSMVRHRGIRQAPQLLSQPRSSPRLVFFLIFFVFCDACLPMPAHPAPAGVLGGRPIRRSVPRCQGLRLRRILRLGRGGHDPQDRRRAQGGMYALVLSSVVPNEVCSCVVEMPHFVRLWLRSAPSRGDARVSKRCSSSLLGSDHENRSLLSAPVPLNLPHLEKKKVLKKNNLPHLEK